MISRSPGSSDKRVWSAVRIAVEGLEDPSRAQRCLGLFEDFCVVTASVKQGIPVSVEVVDDKGNKLA